MKTVTKLEKKPITLESLHTLIQNYHKKTEKVLKEEIKKAYEAGKNAKASEIKSYFKRIEDRLRAYKQLEKNIIRYNQDIEDLKKENTVSGFGSRRSKDIVYIPSGGIKLTEEEILEARILVIKRKIQIDQEEINNIDYALESIKNDEYYMAIEYKYFYNLTDNEISEKIICDPTTIWRNIKRLINIMKIRLYGAESVT